MGMSETGEVASRRSRKAKFSIANRVWLVIGLLLFLFFVTSSVSHLLTKRIEEDVKHLVLVEDARQDAVTEMGIRLAGLARSVFAYAHERSESSSEAIGHWQAEFDRAIRVYTRLAKTDEERGLSKEISAFFDEFKALSEEVVALTDEQHEELAPLRSKMEAVDTLINERIQQTRSRDDTDRMSKFEAVLGMESTISQHISYLEAYAASGRPEDRDKAQVSQAAFEWFATLFRNADLDNEERAWLDQLTADFTVLSSASGRIMSVIDRKRTVLNNFEIQRTRIEGLLDNRLLPAVRTARTQVQRDVSFSISFAIWFLLSMTLFGVVVGACASIALTRGLVQPILSLTEGAEAIGEGRFDYRIDIRSDDELGRLAASFNRMAQNRQDAEEVLRKQAYHDTLTKLPNRVLFQLRLAEGLDNARRVNRLVAVHCLDLNKFKDVNDTLGHPMGDLLLQQVAGRLNDCVRKSDTVARLGGDEFAIIQTNLTDSAGITVLASRVIDSLAMPFDLNDERVYTGTSIGISTYPNDGAEADLLLKNADLALYRAKHEGRLEGRGKYALFDRTMNAEVQARKSLEEDIRRALDNDEFFLNYQPQIDIESGRIVGAEALVRWHHPERGMVSPGEFIPVAEQAALINNLTEIVLAKACAQIRAWHDAGLPPFRVSVNLSPADFKRKDIVAVITRVLDENGLEPRFLELEITEGMVMSSAETVIATLNELHELGVDLAIDDFGTGFSSLSYLKQFPVDRLKIDQAFISDVLSNKEDASITEAIINLGHSFGLTVIAEGVETAEQMDFLRHQGCDEAQGSFISRPLDPEALAEFVKSYTVDGLREAFKTA